ncbi:hypothetical protein LOC67_22675 [Stieleria sp. JC731]|uniref:hypothetical protein n=1 Tax=Stieleria sp. JC731 TaxID=2894195 RepID=UPI001E599FA2|nr:hypothetical protein [Stieleria sp. JC731]MCC9603364.1 hypothetical protein [Stieleria sp. JC731]
MNQNPYSPPPVAETSKGPAGVDSNPSRWRLLYPFRLIPVAICGLLGALLLGGAVFWGYEIFNSSLRSDLDFSVRILPPIFLVVFLVSGISFSIATRYWWRGLWIRAIVTTAIGWALLAGTQRLME